MISYDFTATINDLFEYDGTTKAITHVAASSFSGSLISPTNTVTGRFFYDTAWALNVGYQPAMPVFSTYLIYSSVTPVSALSFEGGGAVTFTADSTSLVQIANNARTFSNSDIFYLSGNSAYNPGMLQTAAIALFDNNGSVFQSGGLPSQLDLASFTFRQLSSAWVRQSDGNQLQMSATLTSLTPTISPAPEPGAVMLFGVGLALLAFASKHAAARRAGFSVRPEIRTIDQCFADPPVRLHKTYDSL